MNRVALLNECFDQRGASVVWIRVVHHDVFCFTGFRKIKDFLMPCVR